MRFAWSAPLAILAAVGLVIPSAATINRVSTATGMAGSCSGSAGKYSFDEYVDAIGTITQAMLDAVPGANTAAGVALISQLGAAARQLQGCLIENELQQAILPAALSCDELKRGYNNVVNILSFAGTTMGGLTQAYAGGVLSNLRPGVENCWKELTEECIPIDDAEAVDDIDDVLFVADHINYPRSDLVPPLRFCAPTVPICQRNENRAACQEHWNDVADIMFGDGPVLPFGPGP